MPIAITRDVSASLADCQLSFVDRSPIDIAKARAQHEAYRRALEALGCEVIALPAQDAMPDAVFVEDVAVVVDEIAVLTRPGAESRRGEGATVGEVLGRYRELCAIEAPGTLDGGDVMRVGRSIYVGQAARTNAAGIAQLAAHVAPFGYTVQAVPTRECLHLKSAVTQVGEDTLLIQPLWIDREPFAGYRLIEVDPSEEHGANALRIGSAGVIQPSNFPRARERLERAGIAVVSVDLSELQKAEGATTCCSIVFRGGKD
ncbi:MAG TPA: arginine deiminase-related protein [Xanthomonadaceae bacterium]|jgi:dimethylargininase